MKKIALEEHFITPDLLPDTQKTDFVSMDPKKVSDFQARLLDFDDLRIKAMDQAEVEISVLSLTDPGIQGIADTKTAVAQASKTNAYLSEKISKHPKRFRGFACLAMQDPLAASAELDHCVRQYGFLGGLINGQTQGFYLDDSKFQPFWKKVSELDVPIYLHPGSPEHEPDSYKGHPELNGPIWGWTAETATHALRLVFSGLFDQYPKLKIILGHMGETLPYLLWRIDSRWDIVKQQKKLKKAPSQYIRDNFYITTSGVCSNGPLGCAIQEMGEDRVMFSMDYPYESSEVAAKFIEKAPFDKKILDKVCYNNAARILKI